MNIMARINARKIVLSYFYQRNFFSFWFSSESIISDILFSNNIYESDQENYKEEKNFFLEQISSYLEIDEKDELDYVVKNFFDQWDIKNIDTDYIFMIGTKLEKYREEIQEHINKYVTSFDFAKMSLINQAIFALWYIEWKELKTEKEILINELIELAKRYDESWSPKLINAVMHKIMSGSE